MKDCTDCIRKNNPEYTKCYCAIYKEHPEKCNYKIRFKCPQTEQAEASSLSDLLADLKTQVGKAAMAKLITDLKYRVYQHEYVGIELPPDDYADYQHDIKVLEDLGS